MACELGYEKLEWLAKNGCSLCAKYNSYRSWACYYPHFTEGETEAQRASGICLRSYSWQAAEPGSHCLTQSSGHGPPCSVVSGMARRTGPFKQEETCRCAERMGLGWPRSSREVGSSLTHATTQWSWRHLGHQPLWTSRGLWLVDEGFRIWGGLRFCLLFRVRFLQVSEDAWSTTLIFLLLCPWVFPGLHCISYGGYCWVFFFHSF